VHIVREWLRVSGHVGQPQKEHPSRKVLGLECKRSEVSGRKFWGLFQNLCGNPDTFFRHAFVYNYCPLAFMTSSGKNITPAELKVLSKLHKAIQYCSIHV
jgi:single-strand selective monofunctional uracil DNA glycosylase